MGRITPIVKAVLGKWSWTRSLGLGRGASGSRKRLAFLPVWIITVGTASICFLWKKILLNCKFIVTYLRRIKKRAVIWTMDPSPPQQHSFPETWENHRATWNFTFLTCKVEFPSLQSYGLQWFWELNALSYNL